MCSSPGQSEPRRRAVISLYLKVPYTVFVCVLVPVYWVEYGPANFLWGSDIALFVTLLALWTESRLLASMMAIGILLPEVAWTLDLALRMVFGPEAIPMAGTGYMFDSDIPLWILSLSAFHLALPVILVWLLYRLGYHRKALLWQTLLLWVVLPLTYAVSDPADNINWVHGFGGLPQTLVSGPIFVLLLMAFFPVALYLPMHLLLSRLFPEPHRTRITLQ